MTRTALLRLMLAAVVAGSLAARAVDSARAQGHEPAKITQRHHASPSPDGSLIVFHAHRPNGRVGLFLAEADGSNERALFVPDEEHAQEPRWSPSGDWIAFVGGHDWEPGSFALQLIRPDGSERSTIATSSNAQLKSPTWSPGGERVAFEVRRRAEGSSHVHVVSIDGSGQVNLTAGESAMNQMPRWAPDGSGILVAWRDAEYEGGDLYLLPAVNGVLDVSAKFWITQTPEIENMPAWHPNGNTIYYVAPDSNDVNDVFGVDVETGDVTQLTDTPGIDEFFPAVSRDGATLFFDAYRNIDGVHHSSIERIALSP